MCRSMVDIQSPTAEIRRAKKKEERNRMKIYMVSLFHRATINNNIPTLHINENNINRLITFKLLGVCTDWNYHAMLTLVAWLRHSIHYFVDTEINSCQKACNLTI